MQLFLMFYCIYRQQEVWKIKEVNVFMKTILKRTIGFFLSLAMIISVACSTAVAAETLEDQNVTSHRVSYIIYKEDGTVKETGTLAMSEEETYSRSFNYGRAVLSNGERIVFKNGSNYFYTNANVSAGLVAGNTTFKSWSGFTGGLSISGKMPYTGNFYAYVRNASSSTIAITWAKVDF